MKDVRDAGDAQVTQAAELPHTSDFLFSDIPLIKGSCSVSYIALLCMDVLREVHSSSLSTSRGDNEVIYNPLQLQRTWRMALPSFASAELCSLCPGSPFAVWRDTGGTRVPRQGHDDFCPSTPVPALDLPVTEAVCTERQMRWPPGHPNEDFVSEPSKPWAHQETLLHIHWVIAERWRTFSQDKMILEQSGSVTI